jgi:hypothetical protein
VYGATLMRLHHAKGFCSSGSDPCVSEMAVVARWSNPHTYDYVLLRHSTLRNTSSSQSKTCSSATKKHRFLVLRNQ